MTLLIGGVVCCGECDAVFASLADYEEHMEEEHSEPDYKGEDACYAEGVRRVR